MKRLALSILALLIASAPVAADLCRLDCERERPPECPLHQQAPHNCRHDHTIGTAALTRAGADPIRSTDLTALVVTFDRTTLATVFADLLDLRREHAPRPRSPRRNILRI